jgi:DNA-binding NarL/FixJ family response regulator
MQPDPAQRAGVEEAIQAGTDELLARAAAAFAAERGWRNQLRAVGYAMLDFLQEDPDRARLMVIESLEAGERAVEIREEGMAALAALIDLGREEMEDPDSLPANTAELTAGAVYNHIHVAIEQDQLHESMVQELMVTAVRPYLGTEVALEELTIPSPGT